MDGLLFRTAHANVANEPGKRRVFSYGIISIIVSPWQRTRDSLAIEFYTRFLRPPRSTVERGEDGSNYSQLYVNGTRTFLKRRLSRFLNYGTTENPLEIKTVSARCVFTRVYDLDVIKRREGEGTQVRTVARCRAYRDITRLMHIGMRD